MIGDTRADKVFFSINYVFLTLALLVTLYPLWYILVSSFSNANDVVALRVWIWPVNFNIDAYEAIFNSKQLVTGYINSAIYAVVGTIINLLVTILAAYPLSRRDFLPRNIIMALFAFTMLFSGGLIPSYLLVRGLGMLDTLWAMVIPGALSVWNVVLMRTYFHTSIPEDLLEAAQLDGCRDGQYLIRIVLPLSGSIIAVMVLFFAVGHWNSYFTALIYLSKASMFPLQIVLRNILIQGQADATMTLSSMDPREVLRIANLRNLLKYALIVVASAPLLAVYPFIQKYFIKGIMLGALKG